MWVVGGTKMDRNGCMLIFDVLNEMNGEKG